MSDTPEATRLESLWSGDFGQRYVERNLHAGAERGPFWRRILDRAEPSSVLEVGCNVGANLRHLSPPLDGRSVYGIDVNEEALRTLRTRAPELNVLWARGRALPFRDAYFDLVFTVGVLIHQPDISLPLVMSEMVRTSRRHVLVAEYHAEDTVEVPYRGERGALFKRDYGRLFKETFPELREVDSGHLGEADGFDDVTWHLFEKP